MPQLVRKLFVRLRPYWGTFAIAIAQVLLMGALEILKPWPLTLVVDHVLTGHPVRWTWLQDLSTHSLLLVGCLGLVLVYALLGGLGAIRVMQAFTTEEDEYRTFVASSTASLDANLRFYTFQGLYTAFINVMMAGGTAAVLWIRATHVLARQLTVGEVLVFLAYLSSLYGPISTLMQTWGLIQGAKVGAERVFEILETAPDLVDGSQSLSSGEVRGAVAFENIRFGYDNTRTILKGIDFQTHPGDLVAIVGATGAGKTTLISLIPRFYDPTEGRVLLDGTDVRVFQLRHLRQQVAMVLQPPLIFPTSVRANIAYGRPDATPEQMQRAVALAQLDDFLARLPQGLDTMVGEGGATLSAGEQLRITIARAILRDAPILILDEPTSALDVATESRVMHGLEALMADRTTFVIAHRLSTVRRADTILVMDDGQIVEQGAFTDLLVRGGPFATLYQTQFADDQDLTR